MTAPRASVTGVTSAPALDAPVPLRTLAFITGCGRSGTTILGRILERHPEVRYLNDRRDLWIRPFPIADIWGRHEIEARVALGAADARALGASAAWFRLLEAERGDRPVLVEKLPINNFRLGFLVALYPRARLINIVRHGVEVARSIERRAETGKWYGTADRKWDLLVEHARAHGYGPLVERCATPFLRGLLEWRMSVEAAEAALAADPTIAVLRLRYEHLIADPVEVARTTRGFLDLPPSEDMDRFAAAEVRRQHPAASAGEAPPGTDRIAGDTLRRMGYWPA